MADMTTVATTTYARAAILGPTRREALARLEQERAAGRILGRPGQLTLITQGPAAGQYAIPVYVIAPAEPAPARVPRWVMPMLAAAVPLGLAVLLVWLLTALTAASLALFLAGVLAAFLGWLKVKYGRPAARGKTTVTTTVTIE
jgi:hypothetical protein